MVNRYEGADGIRGLACLLVLCTHIPGFFVPEAAKYFSGTGKFGVWLFFVLSAFLLTSKFDRNGFSISELIGYVVGRSVRIIPLFFLIIGVYWYFGTANINTGQDVIKAATFQQGYVHLWTIPVEFKYYLLLPFVAFLLIKTKSVAGDMGVFLLTITLVLVHQFVWPYWLTPENSIAMRWYIPCFLFGGYAAVSINTARRFTTPKRATWVALAMILMLLALSPGGRDVFFAMPFDNWLQNKFLYISLIWTVFLIFLADGKGMFGTLMKSKPFRLLGAWSYSIYLIHWLIYATLSTGHQNSFFWIVSAFLGSIGIGAAIYYLVEAPIERLRHAVQAWIRVRL